MQVVWPEVGTAAVEEERNAAVEDEPEEKPGQPEVSAAVEKRTRRRPDSQRCGGGGFPVGRGSRGDRLAGGERSRGG